MKYRAKILIKKSPQKPVMPVNKKFAVVSQKGNSGKAMPIRKSLLPINIRNPKLDWNNDEITPKIIEAFENLEIWKYKKPKKKYPYAKKKIHLIHWWFKDRSNLVLSDLEKFHFSMLWLADFDNKFDEIHFNVALDNDTKEARDFITKSIKELTKNGKADVKIEFRKNSKNTGEFETWVKMLDFVSKADSIIFYSHFKGAKYNDASKILDIKYWCYLMYQGCLMDGWDSALKTLEDNYSYGAISSCAKSGPFKKDVDMIRNSLEADGIKNDGIHYTGTFYFWNGEMCKKYFAKNNIKLTKNKLLGIKGIRMNFLSETLSSNLTGNARTYFGDRSDAGITNMYKMYTYNKYGKYIEKFRNLYKDNNRSKNICYTVIINGYDDLKNPQVISPACRYICFSDDNLKSYVWEIHKIPDELKTVDAKKQSRIIKVMPQKYLPEHEWSMYIDGNITINTDPVKFISDVCDNNIFSIPLHFKRTCLYDEGDVVTSFSIDSKDVVSAQMKRYRDEGFPQNYGLNENNLLVRKNDKAVNKVNEMWANEILKGSYRDQLSLRYCLWKLDFEINNLPATIVRQSKYFTYNQHKK